MEQELKGLPGNPMSEYDVLSASIQQVYDANGKLIKSISYQGRNYLFAENEYFSGKRNVDPATNKPTGPRNPIVVRKTEENGQTREEYIPFEEWIANHPNNK